MDVLINRSLVYGGLTAAVVGLYVLVVGALGALFQAQENLFIALVATGLVEEERLRLRRDLHDGLGPAAPLSSVQPSPGA